MVSIYKLTITVMLLNLLLGLGMVLYAVPTEGIEQLLTTGTINTEQHYQNYQGTEEINTEQSGIQGTYGETIGWGKIIWNVAFKRVDPISGSAEQFGTPLERNIFTIIELLIFMMNIMLAIKAYNFFKNKDTK